MTAKKPKHLHKKMGKPTLYTDEMPQKLIDAMSKGLSVVRFCAQEFIHKDTHYEWVKQHPIYSDAFAQAKILCEAYWEKWLVENLKSKDVNAALVKLYMTNRFGWSDKTENNTNITVKNHEELLKQLK